MITQPRHLELNTPIGADTTVQIAAPRSDHGQAAASAIHEALQAKGTRVEWHDDPNGAWLRHTESPIIIVGNLADSRCVKELYYHSLCATDLWYPGPDGYELRTLCDPLGTGHNLIQVGYSDTEGAAEVARVFAAKLNSTSIPHLQELKVTQLPMPEAEVARYRVAQLPATNAELVNTMEWDNVGYLYYLTGESEFGETYRRVWQAILACGFERTETIVQSHLFSLWRFLPWQLVETTGLFNDEERLAITNYLYGWAQSSEGWPHVANCPRTQRPHNPRQNHELIPALALMHVADYYEAHFPELPGPDQWRAAGRMGFTPYGSSWKPLCDGLCHGITMSLPVMIDYGLIDPEHRFFTEGGARQAAEYALAVINNDGWIPSAGDSGVTRQFPGPILRITADFLGDGRYKFVHDRVPTDRRFGWQPMLPRAFDSGVEPQIPNDQIGVTVIPVDPLVYRVWEREPELAVDAVTSPPSAPIEQCFDKIVVRTGWETADDYLLIDGLGGGSHSYDDAGGIIEYARLGVSVIVQEDSLIHTAPEHHSLVTIVRNGESGVIPGFAILEEQQTDGAGTVYLRIRSQDYAGADWVREVHLAPGKCTVFIDTVTANLAGDYAIEAHFRTPTRIALTENGASGSRQTAAGDEVEVSFVSSLRESQLGVTDLPMELRFPLPEDQANWRERYHTDEMVLQSFEARETASLRPGESVRLVHLAQVRTSNESPLQLARDGAEFHLIDENTRLPLKTFEITRPAVGNKETAASRNTKAITLFHTAKADITALQVQADGSVVTGTQNGTLCYLNPNGSKNWSATLEAPIHDIGIAPSESPVILAGHGRATLTAVNTAGAPLWSSLITRMPSPWPWWELTTPTPIQVAGGVKNGEAFFAVGCGDIQLRGFDQKGKEQWQWRYNEGVPGRVTIADVDGSGKPRIVVGGEILSDQATCRILEPNGRQIAELEVEGWTSLLTALAFGHDGPRRFIGCGANRGNNLHLYEFVEGKWTQRWRKRLGGQVTGIAIFAETNRVIVATSQGFLLGCDLDGTVNWHLLLPNGLQYLERMANQVIAVDKTGVVRVVTLSGHIEKQLTLPAPCSRVAAHPRGIYFAGGSEIRHYPFPQQRHGSP